jgi:hypothetical protein
MPMGFTLWRGVIGMVRPTRRPGTLEELIRILPEGIGVVPLLLNFKAGSNAEFLKSIPLYEGFAAELAEQGVDLIMLSGAPPFMLLGPKDESALTRRWEKKFKTPVVTDPQMHVAGLRAMKIKKFIGASYSALQNKIVQEYMTVRARQTAPPQTSQRRRHLHPGRRLADGTRRGYAGAGSWDSSSARHDLPGLANSEASQGAGKETGPRPPACRAAMKPAGGRD